MQKPTGAPAEQHLLQTLSLPPVLTTLFSTFRPRLQSSLAGSMLESYQRIKIKPPPTFIAQRQTAHTARVYMTLSPHCILLKPDLTV